MFRIKARVILSGVPSRAEAAEGTSGGWRMGEQKGTERSRRIPNVSRAFRRILRLRCERLSVSAPLRMTRGFGNTFGRRSSHCLLLAFSSRHLARAGLDLERILNDVADALRRHDV